ncbi:MAG: phenylacetate--CoA ligase family protein [Nitrospira sp.]|nr:phenylacetate--CoA ligase family protein [Nitrospira sp.]
MVFELLYRAGMFLRNPQIRQKWESLRQMQTWTRQHLEAEQLRGLRNLIAIAYDNAPYYRKKLDSKGLRPSDLNCLEDFKQIPPTSKEDLLRFKDEIQWRVPAERHFYSETSGSTGKPLVFYRNGEWDAWHRASVFRGYHWYGVNPWDRNGYLWGYNFSWNRALKTRLLDVLQNRFRLFSYKNEEIDQFIAKLSSAVYLSGYSSMIYEVAKRVNAKKQAWSFPHLKMIKGTSEKIFDKYRDEVNTAFGIPIISEYGAAEAGIIAFECPLGAMHVNMETVIVEEVNNEVLVTNLVSKSFPIIRYKLGDYIRLDKTSRCACGMQHEIVLEVLGRVGKVIHGKTTQYPSLTLYYVFKNLAMEHGLILNYQAEQTQKGALVLRIEGHLEEAHRTALSEEIEKYFARDLNVQVKYGEELHARKGKKADFISVIDE